MLIDGGYIENGKYQFYLTDHLGNIAMVMNQDAGFSQRNSYYPFGGSFVEHHGNNSQPYKYNGKELDKTHGLNQYDYSARYYDPPTGRFTTVDPMAEKHYSISPYAYCANNPLRFVDPDGRDIYIYYIGNDGNETHWVFNGKNHDEAPINEYVSNVLLAYDYNIENGGGDNLMKAATDSKIKMGVAYYKEGLSRNEGFDEDRGIHMISWDPYEATKDIGGGIFDIDGYVISPATTLEHEFDHGLGEMFDPKGHEQRRKKPNKDYRKEEERRVIQGSEAKTAGLHGEVPLILYRSLHYGKSVRVSDPRSNGRVPFLMTPSIMKGRLDIFHQNLKRNETLNYSLIFVLYCL
ncbi:RHS repeat domain-containing protein [Dysgonomonas sp. 25]|uniref:RHS repeat domain-containing protein n=1 Tax=Dysgonomonas sp. 25 TaxID=2302933 RepID=UPI00351B7040